MDSLTVNQALNIVLQHSSVLLTERVPLQQAVGRVLAQPIMANRDLPPYDVSAMDGFAIRSEDSRTTPAQLTLVEDIKAGDKPQQTLASGQCARIMTGAPVPEGADAVIRVEQTRQTADTQIALQQTVSAGNDIRRRGENMRDGEQIYSAGTEITPAVAGVLASVKAANVVVYRRPSVGVLSTGDELEAIDEPMNPDKIPDANSYALLAQLKALGIQGELLGIASDDPDALTSYLNRGLQYDVLLVSGGTSVGVHDYVRPTLQSLGVDMLFWRVAMKPGHPVAFGKTKRGLLFGLPGNPVSSLVCFEQLVLPSLRQMMGYRTCFRRTIRARLTHDIAHRPGRTEFVRVTLAPGDDQEYLAASTGPQGSGMLLAMSRATGLAVIPSDCDGLTAGSWVTVQLLDGADKQQLTGFQEDI